MKKLIKYLLLFTVLINVNISYSQKGVNQKEFDELQIVINEKFLNLEFDSVPNLLLKQKKIVSKYSPSYIKYLNNTVKYWRKNILIKQKDSIYKYQNLLSETYEYLHLDSEYGFSLMNMISSINMFESKTNFDSLFTKVDSIRKLTNNLDLDFFYYKIKANDLIKNQQYIKALNILVKAETIWDQNSMKQNPPYNEFGYLYYLTKDYKKTLIYTNKSIQYNKKLKKYKRLSQMLNNKAEILKIIGSDSILIVLTLKESIKYAKISDFKYGVANASVQIANYYIGKNSLDSVMYYFNEIDKAVPVIEEKNFLGEVSLTKAIYFFKSNQNTKAYKHAVLAYDIWLEAKDINSQKKTVELLIKINEKNGNYKTALKYEKINYNLRDSLVNRSQIVAFKDAEFEVENFRDSIFNNAKEKTLIEVHKAGLEAGKRSENRLLLIILILISIILFAVFTYRRKRKQTILLDDKNQIIKKALDEKQLLLKEIHHRVKNNFQIVSSLLQLQTKDITDEKALGIVKEGQNRVKSMALIHQKLYQNDDLLIDFNEYVYELFKDLNKVYSNTKVECDILINPNYRLDIDTAMPLGLILNELITNAFKYAFEIDGVNELTIEVIEGQESNQLIVSDNGKGIADSIDLKQTKSIGLKLVKNLAKQLHGKAKFENENGAKFTISFKETFERELLD